MSEASAAKRAWYLAVCIDCSDGLRDPLPMPFDDRERRSQWVEEHLTTYHKILLMNLPPEGGDR